MYLGQSAGSLLALALLSVAAPAGATESATIDPVAAGAIEQVALDYVEGQLEGNAARVARSLHPDLAKRAVIEFRGTCSKCAALAA